MGSAERLAELCGWTVAGYDKSGATFNNPAFLQWTILSKNDITTLLSWHDRAQAADEMAEALKGCNGALIGASEALLARGYVATVDTLGKYIRGAEQALRKWEGAANE